MNQGSLKTGANTKEEKKTKQLHCFSVFAAVQSGSAPVQNKTFHSGVLFISMQQPCGQFSHLLVEAQ